MVCPSPAFWWLTGIGVMYFMFFLGFALVWWAMNLGDLP